MTGTWPLGWQVGDIEIAAQYGKGIGALADSTLGGSSATVDLTSIVGSYAHLLLVIYARGDQAAFSTNVNLRFNADSAANYDTQQVQGGAAAVTAGEQFAATSTLVTVMPAATAGANLFGATVGFIPHYAGTANNKAILSLESFKTGTISGSMSTSLLGGFWRSNAAITRITLLPASGNFVAGTRVTLYGLGA